MENDSLLREIVSKLEDNELVRDLDSMSFKGTEVYGFRASLRGARNPMDSWYLIDSNNCDNKEGCDCCSFLEETIGDCVFENYEALNDIVFAEKYIIGPNDMNLAQKLIKAGGEHRKFLRQIQVWVDIDMPRYWWSEFDTYKFNSKNSCSTMHKLLNTKKEITIDKFLYCNEDKDILEAIIERLNSIRREWLEEKENKNNKGMVRCLLRAKRLLTEGFLQMRTVNTNYEEVRNIYHQRKHHRLNTEWDKKFCDWAEKLPYFKEFIEYK